MSDAVDEHLERALASLADVSTRQLHATAEALERSRNGLRAFGGVFRDVATSREVGSGPTLADFHLRQAVKRGGDELAERLAGAEAPFWRHVRDAVALVSGDD
jgi:hypothetical protein